MKNLKVRHIAKQMSPEQLPIEMDKAGISFHPIDTVNWQEYPYQPKVQFRIAYNDEGLLIHYRVEEKSIKATYLEDNGNVWTDSCVETFIVPGNDDVYYNLETNCIGCVLLGAGAEREGRERAGQEVTKCVQRWCSLSRKTFEEKPTTEPWELALVVPYKAFFKHHIKSLKGQKVKANFYKCGDDLSTPHFLSWNPIRIENPDFHRPDFFAELEFSE